jgi:hypothetical protein
MTVNHFSKCVSGGDKANSHEHLRTNYYYKDHRNRDNLHAVSCGSVVREGSNYLNFSFEK